MSRESSYVTFPDGYQIASGAATPAFPASALVWKRKELHIVAYSYSEQTRS